MSVRLLVACVALAVALGLSEGKQLVSYPNTSIVSVSVPDKDALRAIGALPGVQWYDAPSKAGGIGLVQVDRDVGLRALELAGVEVVETVVEDLDHELREVFRRNEEARKTSDPDDFFAAYRTIEEINQLMDNLHEQFPNITEKVVVGQTLQGRDIRGLQVSAGGSDARKPSVVHQAAHHAREWGTVGPVCYAMQQMATLYGSDQDITAWVDAIEFTFIPVMNVDAYIYTWEVDRNQRKNMRPPPAGYPASCIGIDLNRNWPIDWAGGNSSDDPCSGSYHGPETLSEPESSSLSEWLLSKPNLVGFVDWHTSGNMWMGPRAFTDELPDDFDFQYELSEAAAKAVESHRGTRVRYGTIHDVIYPASGSLVDFLYDGIGVPLPFATELGRTHNPPDSEIWPTCLEWWLAIVEHTKGVMQIAA